ncbi:uncharacterized mitochondrial protein AtMg00810-like [Vicia villosa]|uniref:uncharacterized mitochondrial protein AtMg00810-like n=1 Tax=Vicia villosa TaxID=3911 RepID=UPI00273A7D35|nr:uncharacterized mitochondrial protein AtMg00810-like [Vicia villosa]
MILVCLYVDDILLKGICSDEIVKFNKVLMDEFEMNELGNMVYFIGMETMYSEKSIILHQLKYELELLKRFESKNCKSAITPAKINRKLDSHVEGDNVDATIFKQLVGSLRYFCNTILGIYYVVGIMSRFMNKPKWARCQVVFRILRYIKRTQRYGFLFPSGAKSDSDSDWCGDRVDRRRSDDKVSKPVRLMIEKISYKSCQESSVAWNEQAH